MIPLQLRKLFAKLLLLDQESISTSELTDSFGWTGNEVMQLQDNYAWHDSMLMETKKRQSYHRPLHRT